MGRHFILSGPLRSITTPRKLRRSWLRGSDPMPGSGLAQESAAMTTKDHPPTPDAEPDAAGIEPQIASKTQPELSVLTAAPEADLESRIQQRRAELIATLSGLRTDTRIAATEIRDRLKARLSEIARITKVGIVDGWTNLSDTVKYQLEDWLTQSERYIHDLPARNG